MQYLLLSIAYVKVVYVKVVYVKVAYGHVFPQIIYIVVYISLFANKKEISILKLDRFCPYEDSWIGVANFIFNSSLG